MNEQTPYVLRARKYMRGLLLAGLIGLSTTGEAKELSKGTDAELLELLDKVTPAEIEAARKTAKTIPEEDVEPDDETYSRAKVDMWKARFHVCGNAGIDYEKCEETWRFGKSPPKK